MFERKADGGAGYSRQKLYLRVVQAALPGSEYVAETRYTKSLVFVDTIMRMYLNFVKR